MEGACIYSDKNCWFKHTMNRYDTTNYSQNIEYKEVLGKVFEIVEKPLKNWKN
jgi:hypothetical protein